MGSLISLVLIFGPILENSTIQLNIFIATPTRVADRGEYWQNCVIFDNDAVNFQDI